MSKPDILSFLNDEFLMPQPEVLEHSTKRESLFIGIPKECAFQEKEALVPEAHVWYNGHKAYLSQISISSSFADECMARCKNMS